MEQVNKAAVGIVPAPTAPPKLRKFIPGLKGVASYFRRIVAVGLVRARVV